MAWVYHSIRGAWICTNILLYALWQHLWRKDLCGKLNVKARDLILYTDPFLCMLCIKKTSPYAMNGLEDIKAWKWMKTHFLQFLACYSKKMRASTNMKLTVLERLDICSASFSQNSFLKMLDFCTRPAFNGLWEHIQMLTKCTKFMTQSLNCIFCKQYALEFSLLV